MTDSRSRHRFDFPDNFELWWSTTYAVPPSSIDEYGHMTAVHYPVVFERAASEFLIHALGTRLPDYVTAELSVVYRHEVLLSRSPTRVYVRPTLLGTTTFRLCVILADATGTPCAQADIRYVAWDHESRTKQAMRPEERASLQRHLDTVT
ncbi:acyl-CoA thioesterase [Aeromicrobium sp. CTD01-1L150]|uniref:acyl-CoA thioesterase n=1 Tax=Aeromicrobium sp. CTD01-1L150 TaxID=3341830 RepID=UPI0035C1D47A